MSQGLTTATFSSPAWLEKAGEKPFATANNRLRTAVKESLVPALSACLQAVAVSSAGARRDLHAA